MNYTCNRIGGCLKINTKNKEASCTCDDKTGIACRLEAMNEPRTLKIDINEYITLKLTETGNKHVMTHPYFNEETAKIDSDGNWTEQLWIVMKILDSYVADDKQLIEKNTITVTETEYV